MGLDTELSDLISRWDGAAVVTSYDGPTGTWIFIAIHDDTLGRAVGGCRTKTYPTPARGLRDAMRLGEGMTFKWAAAGLPLGGGKAVLALARELEGEERAGLFRRAGRLIETLNGAFGTGMDLGTSPEDILHLAEMTRYVHGVSADRKSVTDPGPFTARGVLASIKASLARATGSDALQGRSVLVQGVGDVGSPLARMLKSAGAIVLVSDLNEPRAAELGAELDAAVVPPHVVYSMHCDVYSPCAVGATINSGTIPQLNCSVVAGSANNQLEELADGDRLHERGILYAPDYIANSGGAVAYHAMGAGQDSEAAAQKVEGIGDRIHDIFTEASMRNESPVHAARRIALRALGRAE